MNKGQKYLAKRLELISSLFNEGATYEDIGKTFGITRQRVQQILNKQRLHRRKKLSPSAPIDTDLVRDTL